LCVQPSTLPYLEPECPSERLSFIAQREERGVRISRESLETHADGTRERGRAVEHDEREGPAAEQDVGAPRRARGRWRTHDPESIALGERGPIARRERARGVDVRHPEPRVDGALDDAPHERRLPAAARSGHLGEPPARNSARRHRCIERLDPGGESRWPGEIERRENGGELLLEGGEGHECWAVRKSGSPLGERVARPCC
jgi:hypothetical protein